MPVYWGDIHAHCAVSYGKGTPQRALDNARRHLDFCSLTGHAFWPDMPMDLINQNEIIGMHLGGFAKLRYYWKDLMGQLQKANVDGKFVTLPSYEWHSMEFGDYNCYFNSCNIELIDAPSPDALDRKLKRRKADYMMLPHHVGYVRGFRGLNWAGFKDSRSPLIEIYSNHGCGEADDAPYEYHHSMGPRVGETMVREGLLRGHRFGFVASTDNHDGYPGHYGHGRVGVIAKTLSRSSIWRALKQRHTFATTGARIVPELFLNSVGIGEVASYKPAMPLSIRIEGTAPIDKLEIIEAAGRKWRIRRLPVGELSTEFSPGRYKIKIETGWGRAGAVSEWNVTARAKRGRLLSCDPCFRYSQAKMSAEEAFDKITYQDKSHVRWQCRAAANPAGMLGGTHFNAGGTQSVVLDLEADRGTRLEISSGRIKFNLPIHTLAKRSFGAQRSGFGSEAIKIHRAVPEREFTFCYQEDYKPLKEGKGFIYLRITQADGQVAWASPIWFE